MVCYFKDIIQASCTRKCLKADSIKCCRELYDSLEIEGLPKVTIETGDSDTLYCTAHGCQGQIAVCYCV